ncbi:hypothetical protein CBM2615_B80014 [Cupriavidus taiwanensis]|uniref:Uncharacterized protein n=1 Tax=Cupriavidus taiwanensis TaxID=164546 RepID=A0A976G5G7_9BURK|nr:hypothetical protein CBM2615_B80014 [Cupriavidus taiwanensis]SOZ73637.1 hypothetical protein CBM2613_B60014 [Cupriavidus taiwanensis]
MASPEHVVDTAFQLFEAYVVERVDGQPDSWSGAVAFHMLNALVFGKAPPPWRRQSGLTAGESAATGPDVRLVPNSNVCPGPNRTESFRMTR